MILNVGFNFTLIINKPSIMRKILFICILNWMLSASLISVNAQVTIGSLIDPKNGTLLDLKEYDDVTAQAGGRTTNKGVMLPRVALTTLNSLVDITEADAATPLQYAGLAVYNVGTASTISTGLNIWDGTEWIAEQVQQPYTSPIKTYVKGMGGSAISLLTLTIVLNTPEWKKIQFNAEEFDENNEFNISTSEFTAKQGGIYSIYVQLKASSALLNVSDLGVGILKKGSGDTTFTLVAEETFTNISVAVVGNVTPPTRKVQTLVELEAGDVITMAAYTTAANASILGGTHSYFTIHQVK